MLFLRKPSSSSSSSTIQRDDRGDVLGSSSLFNSNSNNTDPKRQQQQQQHELLSPSISSCSHVKTESTSTSTTSNNNSNNAYLNSTIQKSGVSKSKLISLKNNNSINNNPVLRINTIVIVVLGSYSFIVTLILIWFVTVTSLLPTTSTTTGSTLNFQSIEGTVAASASVIRVLPSTTSTSNNSYDSSTSTTGSTNTMTAIVHIGPHKTGTTTIQYETTRLVKQLYKDHYEIPSTYLYGSSGNNYRLAHCLKNTVVLNRTIGSNSSTTTINTNDYNNFCDSDYILATIRIAGRGNNILLSAERFATPDVLPKMIDMLLLPWKPNIRIVAYYRHYYDWFISWHNQIMKKRQYYNLHQHTTSTSTTSSSNSNNRVPIIDWINDHKRLRSLYNTIYTVGSVKRYWNYFGSNNVYVYNVHNYTFNHIRDFFCIVIPNTPHTCQTIINEQQDQASLNDTTTTTTSLDDNNNNSNSNNYKKNSAEVLVYEDIAHAMMHQYYNDMTIQKQQQQQHVNSFTASNTNHNQHYHPPSFTIRQLTQLIQTQHESMQQQQQQQQQQPEVPVIKRTKSTTPNNFDEQYIICPEPQALQLLLTLSIKAYEMFFASTLTSAGSSSSSSSSSSSNTNDNNPILLLQNDFHMASRTVNELCSLNTTKLLTQHPEWKQFYETLFLNFSNKIV